MGCWAVPFKTKQAKELRELMKNPLPVKMATDKLYHVVGDDGLFDILDSMDCDSDCRPTVMNFLQDWFGTKGDFVFDDRKETVAKWREPFDKGACAIFKSMLTKWDKSQRFPS